MKTYKPDKMNIIMGFGGAAYLVAIGIFLFVLSFEVDSESPPQWVSMILFIGACIALYFPFTITYEIQINSGNIIEFKSLIRKISISPHDIISIKAANSQVTIKHLNGKVRIPQQMDGFCEFITTLKQVNPSIELKGC